MVVHWLHGDQFWLWLLLRLHHLELAGYLVCQYGHAYLILVLLLPGIIVEIPKIVQLLLKVIIVNLEDWIVVHLVDQYASVDQILQIILSLLYIGLEVCLILVFLSLYNIWLWFLLWLTWLVILGDPIEQVPGCPLILLLLLLLLFLVLQVHLLKILLKGPLVGLVEELWVLGVDNDCVLVVQILVGVVALDVRKYTRLVDVRQHQLVLLLNHIADVVDKGVLEQLIPVHPVSWVVLKAVVQKVKPFQRQFNVLRNFVVSSLQVILKILLRSARERRESSEHLVEYSAKAPHIRLLIVASSSQNFGSHVKGSAALGLSEVFVKLLGESEVGNNDIHISDQISGLFELLELGPALHDCVLVDILEVNEDICKLEISMNYLEIAK